MNTDEIWSSFQIRLESRWAFLEGKDLSSYRKDLGSLCLEVQQLSQEPKAVIQNFVDNLWFELFVRPSRQNYSRESLNQLTQ